VSADHYLSAVEDAPDGATARVDGTPVDATTGPDVDTTQASRGGHAELPPIFAAWLKDRREFATTAASALHRTGHRAAWHAVRWPVVRGAAGVHVPARRGTHLARAVRLAARFGAAAVAA